MKKLIALTFLLAGLIVLSSCSPQSSNTDNQLTSQQQNTDLNIAISKCTGEQKDLDNCYSNIANEKLSLDACTKISDNNRSIRCRNTVLSGLAAVQKDSALCEEITASALKDACFTVVAVQKKDVSLCKDIESISLKDNCYTQIAKATNDSTVCNLISDKELRMTGYNLTYKDMCLNAVGIASLNADLCRIGYEGQKCISEIAKQTLNAKLCDKLSSLDYLSTKNDCYHKIAVKLKDVSLCDKIVAVPNVIRDCPGEIKRAIEGSS